MQFGALIVDDHEDVRTLMSLIIRNANEGLFVSGTAANGEEAVSRADELDPDVIVMDEMMPGMTGIEATERIRARRPDQVVVLCSAYLDEGLEARARAAGVHACVSKEDVARLPAVLQALGAD